MKSAIAWGAASLVILVLAACSDDRSAGGRAGTENTVKFGCLVDGKPMADVSIRAFRHGILPEYLGGRPLIASALSDSQGNVTLTFPSDVRLVDFQVRANMRGMNARAFDVTRGAVFVPNLQPTGVLAWRDSRSDNPCPARQCGIWFEGTDYGTWLGDTLTLWTDAPNGTYWPVIWFRDSLGVRLVRFDSVDVKFTTSYKYFSDVVPKYEVLYEGLGHWAPGCHVKLPIEKDTLTGLPYCR